MISMGAAAPGNYFDEQARFEAMRNHARNGQILQKHKDLKRACEKLIRGYEREARYETSRLTLNQSEYTDRLRALEKMEGSRVTSLKAPDIHVDDTNQSFKRRIGPGITSKISGKKRSVLLFRIENREGLSVYTNVAQKRAIQLG